MAEVIVEPDVTNTTIIIEPIVLENEVIVTPPGTGGGGSGSTFQNMFLSETDPGPGLEPGFLYVWFVLDNTGSVIDIRKGEA